MKTPAFEKGTQIDLHKKPSYHKARVKTSRLNEGSDTQWKGTRSGDSPKASTGKKMGMGY
jgi:hypothetical protein